MSAVGPAEPSLREGSVPDPAQPHHVLWNTAAYAALRAEMAGRRTYEHQADGSRTLGSFTGVVISDEGRRSWCSGYMAPYGGVDYCRDHESVDRVAELVAAVVGDARAAGLDEIVVRAKPPHYSDVEAYTAFQLMNDGFVATATELNAYVDLRPFADHDAYEASLRKETRKALRGARGQSLVTELADDADTDAWRAGHEVLRLNRQAKGRPMYLTLPYLCAIRAAFPGLVRMVITRRDAQVVAASVIYRMARARDYVVYWGDAGHELGHSPMPLLASEVLRHCLDTGAATVDLGICSSGGTANPGLVQFKRSMGARFETRLELSRRLRGT